MPSINENQPNIISMKTMTCNQLGGACNIEFQASTFEEMAELSKKHGMEMFNSGDENHLIAMQKMQELMQSTNAMNEWFEGKRREFDLLPNE